MPVLTRRRMPVARHTQETEAASDYVFSHDGQLMLSRPLNADPAAQASLQDAFAEACAFVTAMNQAITSTQDPLTAAPYSPYNYQALERITHASQLFVRLTDEDIRHDTDNVGAQFSRTLLESLLDLPCNAADLAFADRLLTALAEESRRIAQRAHPSQTRVGHLMFICAELLGMPVVSAVLFSADWRYNNNAIRSHPCLRNDPHPTRWRLHRSTYLFVLPPSPQPTTHSPAAGHATSQHGKMVEWLKEVLTEPDHLPPTTAH